MTASAGETTPNTVDTDSTVSGTDPPAQTATTIKAAGRGLRWSLLGTVGIKFFSFGMGLVLARLLSPADFGLYAIALSATQFVMHVNDVGLIAAVVQWRGRFEAMAPTATTLALTFSAIVYGAFWWAAPSFAALAGSPAATPLVRLLTLSIIVDGITAVRSASLMRNFQQDRLTKANAIGFVATFATSISIACAGGGAYAFVCGQLAGVSVTGVAVLILARVPVQFGLDRAVAGKLLRFGIPLAASLGVEALLMNADYVIVGRLLGAAFLGYYLLAFNTSSWAVSLMGTAIRYVSIPVFSRLSDQPSTALSDNVRRSITLLVTTVTPVVVLMSLLAEPMVSVLYGAKWAPAVAVLQFLMILTGVRLFTSLTLDILTGLGTTRSVLWVNLAWVVALLPALYTGTRLTGIRGTAIAHVLVGLLVAVPLSALALHRAGVRLAPLPRALARPLLAGVLTGALTVATSALVGYATGGKAAARLAIAGLVGLVCYAATAVPRQQLRDWVAMARRR